MNTWQLIDLALTAFEMGVEKIEIVKGVRANEENGASPRQIADYLKGLEAQADAEAQAAIDTKAAEGK